MLTKKSDYRYVDVSGINITGNNLPYRELHPTAGENARAIRKEDIAFLVEAVMQKNSRMLGHLAPITIGDKISVPEIGLNKFYYWLARGSCAPLEVFTGTRQDSCIPVNKRFSKTEELLGAFNSWAFSEDLLQKFNGVMPTLKCANMVFDTLSVSDIRGLYSDIGEFNYILVELLYDDAPVYYASGKRVKLEDGAIKEEASITNENISTVSEIMASNSGGKILETHWAMVSFNVRVKLKNITRLWAFLDYWVFHDKVSKNTVRLVELSKVSEDQNGSEWALTNYFGEEALNGVAESIGLPRPSSLTEGDYWNAAMSMRQDFIAEVSSSVFNAEVDSLGWQY